jgi:hypothetical protein
MRPLYFILLCGFFTSQAQKADSVSKTHYKYLGIQANLLFQQFISFNSNSSINSNPYIFSYSRNNIRTGTGFVFGTGLGYTDATQNDGVTSRRLQSGNVAFRFGSERKFFQESRFIPFFGIEFVAGLVFSRSENSIVQPFNPINSAVQTTRVFGGGALRGGVLLALSKHVMLGTEAFFNLQVSYSETLGNNGGFAQTALSPFSLGFQAPTALFLIVRY